MEESILYGSDPGSEGEAEGVPSEAEEDTRLDENQDEQKSAKPPKKKKTVKNPMPKLDEVRLMGPRGMTAIEAYFKEVELKGKGHELQDLDLIMGKLQLWTHRLFPQMKFEDTLEKIEALGHKKPVQAQLHKIRLGLITQSDVEGIVGDDDRDRLTPDDARLINDVPTTSADDIFDNLVASQSLPTQRSSQVIPSSASSPSSPYLALLALNQLGSVCFYVGLSDSDLSLAVPITKAISLLVNIGTGQMLGEKRLTSNLFKGLQKNLSRSSFPDGHYPAQMLASLQSKCLVWESETSTLLCQALSQDSDLVETIVPTHPPHFSVSGVELNAEKTAVCIYGKDGVSVIEFPDSVTSNFRIRNTSKAIGAKTVSIGEMLFLRNSTLQVMQVKWHPGSPTDSHISVLTSDSILRTYDYLHPERAPVTQSIGRKSGFSSGAGGFPSLRSVGEVAVAFDFGPPSGDLEESQVVFWPVFVLFGNGAVYMFHSNLMQNMDRRTVIHGPLPMRPQSDDNYDGNYCDILCLHSQPPTLVLATSDLSVYHCIFLMDSPDEGSQQNEPFGISRDGLKLNIMPRADPTNHVTEILSYYAYYAPKRDVGVNSEDELEDEEFTVRFYKDSLSKFRYFVSHGSGVHGVCLTSLIQLSQSLQADEQPDYTVLNQPSVAEYMLCTQISGQEPAAPLGLTIVDYLPLKLVVLTRDGQMHIIPISLSLQLGRLELTSSELSVLKGGERVESDINFFSERIKKLLQKSTVQPRLHLADEQALTVDAQIQLVTRNRDVFWKEYISRLSLASEEVERRSELLRNRLMSQKEELTLLEGSKQELQREAELIAEQYEDLKEKQETFEKRLTRLLSLVQQFGAGLTQADSGMKRRLMSVEADLPKIDVEVQKLKQFVAKSSIRNAHPASRVQLTDRQASSIKETLQTQSIEIRDIMAKMSELQEQLVSTDSGY